MAFFDDIGLLPVQEPINIQGLQSLNRMQNIFGPPPDPFGNMGALPMQIGNQPQPFDMRARMGELYQPRMDMQNRFNSMLDQFPQPQNPSMLRKIGAALYGMSQPNSFEAATQFANAPYFNALNQYKMQLGPLQQAADNERLMNAQDRQFAQSIASQEMAQRRLEESERAARARVDIAQQREDRLLAHNQAKIDLANWKAKNPNGVVKEGADGFLYVVNPQTGQEIKTAVEHGRLTDLERINLTAAHAMDRVVTQQEGATNRTAMTQAGATERTRMGQEGAMERTQYNVLNRPLRTSGSPAVNQTVRAKQAVSEHPEWAPYIKFTPSGQFLRVEAPVGSAGLFGFGAKPSGDANVTKQINDYIFGRAIGSTVPTNQQSNSTANKGGEIMKGRVVVEKNGQKFSLPANQLQQAIAQGYVEVRAQ